MNLNRIAPSVVALLLGSALSLSAQTVRTRGYGESDLDVLLRATIASGARLITRDTLISSGDTLTGPVLVLKSRFIVEGVILGDLTAVESNVYLRPAARVTGAVVNIAGGLYASEQARTGSVEDRPLAPYHVTRSGTEYTIEGTVTLPALKPFGALRMPEYNRVDGLRVEFGPRVLLPPLGPIEPTVSGSVGYATEREEVMGRVRLDLKRGRSTLSGGWDDDVTETNEEWIRSAMTNSLSFIWNGKDYRDYFAVERLYAEFRRVLERGDRTSSYWLRGQREDASPLAAGDPFVIWKPDSVRANLHVPASRTSSLIIGAQTEWAGNTTIWEAQGALEFAGRAFDADHVFNAYSTSVEYAAKAIANHTLKIVANFRGPLPGTEDLPLQRWTFVGGSGTLYTFPVATFRGDRLAFVETEYHIPFAQRYKLPVLGRPTMRLMHNAGMAWSRSTDADFEQNIGARLQFSLAYVRVLTNPRHFGDDVKFSVGVSLPGKTYPWERAR